VIVSASGVVQFDGDGKTGGDAGYNTEEEAEAETVSDTEDDGVGHSAGE
jgi:hypothetical protein